MRIIAGRHRSRRLRSPPSNIVRPTTDRVRESLFSIIGDLTDAVVVDAYAGSGALGCESLSRGAEHVFFFDLARRSIDIVRANVETLGELDHATIVHGDFSSSIRLIDRDVDVVFVDPPYGSGEPALALEALASSAHTRRDCLIVLEQDIRDELPEHADFAFDESRTYGDTRVTFLFRR